MSENNNEILKIHLDHMQKSMDENWKHARESLHDMRNEMARLEFISQQMATLVEKSENMKEDIEENKKFRINNTQEISNLKGNFKWLGRIIAGAQTILIALAAHFFKIDK